MANGWTWPFSKAYTGSYEEGQQFGHTSYLRPGGSYFHDGFDFGSAIYGQGSDILAVGDGEVIYAGVMGSGLGSVIVLSIPPYQVMYQEFSTSHGDIAVHQGQHVAKGQKIGRLNASHLHLGITKKDWQTALGSWSVDDGTWLNPIDIIKNGASSSNTQTIEGEVEMVLLKITDTGSKMNGSIWNYNGDTMVRLDGVAAAHQSRYLKIVPINQTEMSHYKAIGIKTIGQFDA